MQIKVYCSYLHLNNDFTALERNIHILKKEIDLIKAENETLIKKLVARMEKLESEINLKSELPPCETCEYEPSKKENLGEHIGNSHEPVSEEILFKCDFWNY